ncbi:MAG: biotin/lipoyl-containing protein [Clostridia bacterium]
MRRFNVTVNGNQYQVEIEEVSGAFAPPVARMPAPAPVAPATPIVAAAPVAAPAAPIAPAAPAKSTLPEGGVNLSSPMPGTIVKIVAKEGASVKKGEVVVVLEAMKMENDIVANAEGIIAYAVLQGQNVNSGDVIAVIN